MKVADEVRVGTTVTLPLLLPELEDPGEAVEETLDTNEGVGAADLEGVEVGCEKVPMELGLTLLEGLEERDESEEVENAGVPLPAAPLAEERAVVAEEGVPYTDGVVVSVPVSVGENEVLVVALKSPELVAPAEGVSKEGVGDNDATPELLLLTSPAVEVTVEEGEDWAVAETPTRELKEVAEESGVAVPPLTLSLGDPLLVPPSMPLPLLEGEGLKVAVFASGVEVAAGVTSPDKETRTVTEGLPLPPTKEGELDWLPPTPDVDAIGVVLLLAPSDTVGEVVTEGEIEGVEEMEFVEDKEANEDLVEEGEGEGGWEADGVGESTPLTDTTLETMEEGDTWKGVFEVMGEEDSETVPTDELEGMTEIIFVTLELLVLHELSVPKPREIESEEVALGELDNLGELEEVGDGKEDPEVEGEGVATLEIKEDLEWETVGDKLRVLTEVSVTRGVTEREDRSDSDERGVGVFNELSLGTATLMVGVEAKEGEGPLDTVPTQVSVPLLMVEEREAPELIVGLPLLVMDTLPLIVGDT